MSDEKKTPKSTALLLLDHASEALRNDDCAASLAYLIRAAKIWLDDEPYAEKTKEGK